MEAPNVFAKIKYVRGWGLLLAILIGLIIWQACVWLFQLPAFILPPPIQVANRFIAALVDGILWRNFSTTLMEVTVGLLAGSSLAAILGYLLAKSKGLERVLAPFLVASQAIPIAAIAPLLVIWFGPGIFSKVLICALIVFFPVLINTMVGVRSVPENLHDLMCSLHASKMQTLRYLEFPAALPVLLGGLRIGATLSVIGAVVGELVGADRGLGFLINVGRGQYDTALVFVAVFTLVALALSLYGAVVWLEKKFLRWQKENES